MEIWIRNYFGSKLQIKMHFDLIFNSLNFGFLLVLFNETQTHFNLKNEPLYNIHLCMLMVLLQSFFLCINYTNIRNKCILNL